MLVIPALLPDKEPFNSLLSAVQKETRVQRQDEDPCVCFRQPKNNSATIWNAKLISENKHLQDYGTPIFLAVWSVQSRQTIGPSGPGLKSDRQHCLPVFHGERPFSVWLPKILLTEHTADWTRSLVCKTCAAPLLPWIFPLRVLNMSRTDALSSPNHPLSKPNLLAAGRRCFSQSLSILHHNCRTRQSLWRNQSCRQALEEICFVCQRRKAWHTLTSPSCFPFRDLPPEISQSLTLRSKPPVASNRAPGLNCTAFTSPSWASLGKTKETRHSQQL